MQKTVRQIAFPPRLQRKKQVAAYARVSSGKDAMKHSLSAQVSYYSDLIQKEPEWQYVGVYSDEAISGTKESRPGFQSLIADCRDGKIDLIITKSISRFARNTVTLLETVRMLKELGVDIYFEEQNIHTLSADGELMLSILASYAQEEARSTSENQRWRVKKNFEEGMPWNGVVLGYRMVNGAYSIVPDEAAIVKRIFAEYVSGKGSHLIAQGLDNDGVPTRRGERWHTTTIRRILMNYNYTGNLILQKTYRKDYMSKTSVINDGQLPKYHIEDAHEPIIDMETFNLVQAMMAERAAKYNARGTKPKTYPYSGLIVCAKCGRSYRRKIRNHQVTWICATYNTRGKEYCSSKQVPEKVIDEILSGITDDLGKVEKIEADDGNTLRFYMKDGNILTRTWVDRSRTESWTDEMKAEARRKLAERRQK